MYPLDHHFLDFRERTTPSTEESNLTNSEIRYSKETRAARMG